MFHSLEHVEAQLERGFVLRSLLGAFGAELDEDAGKFKGVIKDVELQHLVELCVLLRLEEEAEHQSLLRWLNCDVVFQNAAEELANDGCHISRVQLWHVRFGHFLRLCLQGELRVINEVAKNLLGVVLKDNRLTRKHAVCRRGLPQETINGVGMERSVCLQATEALELDDE